MVSNEPLYRCAAQTAFFSRWNPQNQVADEYPLLLGPESELSPSLQRLLGDSMQRYSERSQSPPVARLPSN